MGTSHEDVDKKTLKTTLTPHLIALSAQERQTIPKVGDGTFPFVEKVMEYASKDDKFLPPFVSLEEIERLDRCKKSDV